MKTTNHPKNGKRLLAAAASVATLGTAAIFGAAFLVSSRGDESDQHRQSIAVAAIAVAATSTPAPEDTEAPAVVEEDPAGEPTTAPEDTGEAPEIQPEATVDQGDPAPTQTPVAPSATPSAPAPSPTPDGCQNCPTPALGAAPAEEPVIMIMDFWPPSIVSALKHECHPNKTWVEVVVAEQADVWVTYTTFNAHETLIQHGTIGTFELPTAPNGHHAKNVLAHARDDSGNESTFVPGTMVCG